MPEVYACLCINNFFQHGMPCGDFKDLPRRTSFDEVLHNKAFDTSKNLSYD